MRCFFRYVALLGVLCVLGCVATPAPRGPIVDVTPEQVKSSNDLGLIRSLQATLRAALIDKTELDYPEEFALLGDIESRLAQLIKQRVESVLDSKRVTVEDGAESVVPLPDLGKIADQVKGDESLTDTLLPQVLAPIKREERNTQAEVERYIGESKQEKLGPMRRAQVYHYVYTLSGESHWQTIRDKQMDIILEPIRTAAARGSYSRQLESKVDFVRSIYRSEPKAIVAEMLGVYTIIYTNRYFYKLNRDDLNGAYQVIVNLSDKPDFNLISERLKEHKTKMLDAYAAKLDMSLVNPENVAQSYDYLLKWTDINRVLNAAYDTDGRAETTAKQLYARYQQLKSAGNHASALGMLYAIYDIYPNFESIISDITSQESLIYKSAIARIEVNDFYARNAPAYSKSIATRIESYLRGSLPFDVVVVPSVQSAAAGTGNVIGAVARAQPLQVAGNILQVKVDTSEKPIKKTLEVTTGQNAIPNPDLFAWLDLPVDKRAGIEKPQETIMVERRENIAIGAQLHRKTGVFATSFRLLDRASNKVLYADSITLQQEYQDESNTVFEVGDVVIPAKQARLPEDKEILDKMAEEIAQKIGQKLEGKLMDREQMYIAKAEQAAAGGHCQQEVDNLAKALAILRAKGQDIEAQSKRLRRRAVDCTSESAFTAAEVVEN